MSKIITTNILEEPHWREKHSAPVPQTSPHKFFYLTRGIVKKDERHEAIMANHRLWQQKMDVKRYDNRRNSTSNREELEFLSKHPSMSDFGNDAHIARRENRIGVAIIVLFVIVTIAFFVFVAG